MSIVLTGGTGYLGRHICQRLNNLGLSFTALSRSPQSESYFKQANILNPNELTDVFEGCHTLIHSAGLVSHTDEDSDRVWQIHVQGTQNIINAAKSAGVKRLVYLSTSGTIAVSTSDSPISNEESPSPFATVKEWPYYRSKLFAEQIALEANDSNFEVVSLNPSLLLGPGDTVDGVSTKPVRLFLDDELPVPPSGGIAFVDVRDVADIVIEAMSKGEAGQRYLLNGANMSFLEFYQKIARISDKSPPLLQMPKFTRKALSWIPEWKKIGENFGMSLERHDILLASHFWYVDDSKARKELNWTPRDPLSTLEDTVSEIHQRDQQFSPWA